MNKIKSLAPYLLGILCILAGGYHLSGTVRSFEPSNDMVSPWEEHMKLIRETLPEDVFVVSYLEKSDVPSSFVGTDSAEFYMTQYGVAPIAIVPGFGYAWIIGNFGNTVPLESITPWLDEKLGKYTIQDLGFGIYVIHDLQD